MADLVVGLTGGIASGKSTVARQLASAGLTVVDADEIVDQLYAKDGAGSRAIAELFGSEYLNPDGTVDRNAVANRVFSDASERKALESIIHPLVRHQFNKVAQATDGILVLEAALLVETGWGAQLNFLVTVEAPVETRVERAALRDGNRDEAERRIAAQSSGEARRSAAHFVIENDRGLDHLDSQVKQLVRTLQSIEKQ